MNQNSEDKEKTEGTPQQDTHTHDHHDAHAHDHEHGHVHGPGCSHGAQTPFVRTNAKVGRNDPCSCGSGAKFKKCCGKS